MAVKQRKQISNKHNLVKNPNWQEADQLAIYKAWPRIWTQDSHETNPTCGRVEALNLGPPDYSTRPPDCSTNALNPSGTLPLAVLYIESSSPDTYNYFLSVWREIIDVCSETNDKENWYTPPPPSPDTHTTDKDKPYPLLDFIVALAEVACGWIEVRWE